jgi:hypothetical protein
VANSRVANSRVANSRVANSRVANRPRVNSQAASPGLRLQTNQANPLKTLARLEEGAPAAPCRLVNAVAAATAVVTRRKLPDRARLVEHGIGISC